MTEDNIRSAFDTPLWIPDTERVARSNLTRFIRLVNEQNHCSIASSRELHAWSIHNRAAFWSAIWDFCGIKGVKGEIFVLDGEDMPGAKFFPEATLNFAENLLRRHDDRLAIVFRGEDKVAGQMVAEAEVGAMVA